MNSLGDFHHSAIRFLASFAEVVSKSKERHLLRPEQNRLASYPPHPRKAGYVCTQHYRQNAWCTALQVPNLLRTQARLPQGITSVHKNRSPQKQGRV